MLHLLIGLLWYAPTICCLSFHNPVVMMPNNLSFGAKSTCWPESCSYRAVTDDCKWIIKLQGLGYCATCNGHHRYRLNWEVANECGHACMTIRPWTSLKTCTTVSRPCAYRRFPAQVRRRVRSTEISWRQIRSQPTTEATNHPSAGECSAAYQSAHGKAVRKSEVFSVQDKCRTYLGPWLYCNPRINPACACVSTRWEAAAFGMALSVREC